MSVPVHPVIGIFRRNNADLQIFQKVSVTPWDKPQPKRTVMSFINLFPCYEPGAVTVEAFRKNKIRQINEVLLSRANNEWSGKKWNFYFAISLILFIAPNGKLV